jgi:hypothetical protein
MTFTEISEVAGKRLHELTEIPILDAVHLCIQDEFIASNPVETSHRLFRAIQEITPYYLMEATASNLKSDAIIERADHHLEHGMPTGGQIINLDTLPDWDKYKEESRNVRYKLHSWIMLDALLAADQYVNHSEYLDRAVLIADDWITRYIMKQKFDEFSWYDMAVGQRATKLAYMTHRLIQIGARPEQIFRFICAIEVHCTELMVEERVATHSNHGLFQMAGLIAIAKTCVWLKNSDKSIEFGIQKLLEMMHHHFARDGLHLEHSPDYHFFMVNLLKSFEESNWLTSSKDLIALISSVESAASWLINPELNSIPIGDTANNAKATRRWSGGTGPLHHGMMVFPQGGLVIENSGFPEQINQLVFSAQFHSRQHKHADDLNILYHLRGSPLLIDAGTYTYQYDLPERIYCESTRAHNTVEIDGLNFSRFRKHAFGSALKLAKQINGLTLLAGHRNHRLLISPFIPNNRITNTDGVQCAVGHSRIIIHYPERFLAVLDIMNSNEPHSYVQWNHLAPNLQVKSHENGFYDLFELDEKLECRVISVNTAGTFPESVRISGQSQPHLQGWYSFNGRDLAENSALGFKFSSDSNAIATVYDFVCGSTNIPYFRVGSKGKYIRFSLTQNKNKVDVTLRETTDGYEILCINDGNKQNADEPFLET